MDSTPGEIFLDKITDYIEAGIVYSSMVAMIYVVYRLLEIEAIARLIH